MNLFLKTVAGIVAFTAGSLSANAADYADISTDKQVQTRSAAQDMPAANREIYCSQMKSRIQSMSSKEREQFGKIMIMPVEKKIVLVRVLASDPVVGITTVRTLPAINNNMWLSRVCSKGTEKTSESTILPSHNDIYSI